MNKDSEKCFNKDGNLCANQQLFRGMGFKERVAVPNEIIDLSQCNRALAQHGVSLHRMCLNERCEALHNPGVQKHCLINE